MVNSFSVFKFIIRITTMTYKEQIEAEAIAEAEALSRIGNKQRDKRVKLQTGSYSADKFSKLFTVDKLHNESEE